LVSHSLIQISSNLNVLGKFQTVQSSKAGPVHSIHFSWHFLHIGPPYNPAGQYCWGRMFVKLFSLTYAEFLVLLWGKFSNHLLSLKSR